MITKGVNLILEASLNLNFNLDVVRASALLHDIGKLNCWATRKPWSEHVYYTYKFVEKCLGENMAAHAMRHHIGPSYGEECHPKTLTEKIVCLADNLASGADRREAPERGSFLPPLPIKLTHVLNPNVVRCSMDSERLTGISKSLLENLGKLEEAFNKDSTGVFLHELTYPQL
ncbi:TPA: HD domain-containing protein, partial [Candidatus Bathyarchaeota archaeon]|nr:HD domain-containing protein [Candidatus Bathyarchaeota archaeon]